MLEQLRAVNASAAFNRWAGFEVTEAEPGRVCLRLEWREDLASTRDTCTLRSWRDSSTPRADLLLSPR